jgi:predicted permease
MYDLRFAFRALRKSPGFAATAILTLALAIGANSAVFTLVSAVLLRPLPFPEPDRLVQLARVYVRDGTRLGEDISHAGVAWAAIRDHASTVDGAVYTGLSSRINLAIGDRAIAVRQSRVSAGFFRVLGIGPAQGREFAAEEDRAGGSLVMVISHRLWRSVLNEDPGVIGRSLLVRGEPHTVIGVMPDGFRGLAEADVWTPVRPSTTGEGGGQNYGIILRLRDGVAWGQADGDVAAAVDAVMTTRTSASGVTVTHGIIPLQRGLTGDSRRSLLMLWAAVGIVLVVAIVNLSGLLLARAGLRAREIGTRLAVGASRWLVLRQLLVESLVLAVIGGALGLIVGVAGVSGLQALAGETLFPSWANTSLDWRVALMAVGLTGLTALAFGLVPAVQASRVDVQAVLAEGGSRSVAGGARGWPRRLLVVAEVALGVVLLVGAGLLIRTFVHLQTLAPGFDANNLVAASASLDDARYRTEGSVARLTETTLTNLRALPGVEAAAASLGLPYERILNFGFQLAGADNKPEGTPMIASTAWVTTGYFEALRIPIRRGRAIDDRDSAAGQPVVVVNETFVREYLKDRDPIGVQIAMSGRLRQIVGVSGDVLQVTSFGDRGPVSAMPAVYLPVTQVTPAFVNLVHTWFAPAWIVRQRTPGAVSEAMLRGAMAAVDPQLPLAAVRNIAVVRSAALAEQRLLMTLVGLLGFAALLLAAIGIHGLIASGVTERTRELGIRMALGATVGQAIRTAALPGIALSIAGLAVGSGAALGVTGLIRSQLWGVSTSDPTTFIAVALTLFGVAAAASILPALRVRKLDPAALLRE